jgi:hypothetical protein
MARPRTRALRSYSTFHHCRVTVTTQQTLVLVCVYVPSLSLTLTLTLNHQPEGSAINANKRRGPIVVPGAAERLVR